jgi:probable rRNA maturation factor
MNVIIDLENASTLRDIPEQSAFEQWVNLAQTEANAHKPEVTGKAFNLGIRIVDEAESTHLNSSYRNKNAPTNVLSFSSNIPDFALPALDEIPLGDLAICASVVASEAAEQQKFPQAHWAHMVIHGVLHLNGFDHNTDAEASAMEALEVKILNGLGFPDPYLITEQI